MDKIHRAARHGDVATVVALLDAGTDVNSPKKKSGITPLHLAAEHAHVDLMRLLIDRGADLYAEAGMRGTPLHWASKPEAAQLLLASGVDVDTRSSTGETPLHEAAKLANAEMVAFFLENGADPCARTEKGKTPLNVALGLKVPKLLEEAGGGAPKKKSRLMAWAENTNVDGSPREPSRFDALAERTLARHHADQLSIERDTLVRALLKAARSGDTAKVQQLIDKGADVTGAFSDVDAGSTALHCALRTRSGAQKSDLVRLLIDNGADVNVRTERGESEETRALRWVNVDVLEGVRMVSKLIIGDMSPATKIGLAPLDMAAAQNESDIAQLLIDSGADVNAQGENAETALHITAVYGAYETAKVLIEAGADTTSRTEGKRGETAGGGLTSGGTPLQWALRRLEQATLPQKSRARMEATAELLRSAGGTTELPTK